MPDLSSGCPQSASLLKPEASQAARRFPSVSVVICCHNSAVRLPETLRHLAEQQTCGELTWEILVVDNASSDETIKVVKEFSAQHPRLALRVINEPQLGTAYARQRGVAEARHEIILFVDDDNWLASDYLNVLVEVMENHPEIAALGGMSTAQCDVPVPNWLTKYQGWYAVTGAPMERSSLTDEGFLWTAGTAFRRAALDRVRNSALPLVSGRRGESLDAGEDEELSHLIRLYGGRLCRYSGLHFRHYLPAKRLTWDYLRRLHYGGGVVSVKLDLYRFDSESSRWPKWILQSWLAQVCNVCLQILRYRFLVGLAGKRPVEGNDHVLRLDLYRGRFRALWLERHSYRKMLARRDDVQHLTVRLNTD